MGMCRALMRLVLAISMTPGIGIIHAWAEPRIVWTDKTVIGGEDSRFQVLATAYPNHSRPGRQPVSTHDLALRMSYDMDVLWFGTDPAMSHFAITETTSLAEDGEVWSGFDFGPSAPDSDDFVQRHQIVIRQTAGGGFMLLVEKTSGAYADRLKTIFQNVVDDRDRTNPEVPLPHQD